jgi:hypothetical protein
VTFTLGGSGDFFHTDSSSSESRDQFNPKFGIVWNPLPDTTLRAAAFKTLKRTLITDQTLEPTQVAGFNQFFDEADSTSAWLYGAAVDQKFSRTIFGGTEFFMRDLRVPFTDITANTVERTTWKEYLGRTYLFWTPHPWVAMSGEYQYDQFKREDFVTAFKKVATHRVPLGLRFFHPSGFSAGLKATYLDQTGDFKQRTGDCCESGKDNFWVVDAAINYRLPKRYGFIAVGVTNLFDKKFKYQETDLRNPMIQPDRVFFGRLTLALP